MAIMVAIQDGDRVKVYDTSETEIISRTGILHGYTCEFVAISNGKKIEVYDENDEFVNNF